MEEEPPSPAALVISSRRRTLSLLRDRRVTTSAPNSDASSPNREQRTSAQDDLLDAGFARAYAHGPKPSEVYGFIGSITTIISTVVYLVWAYTPEWLLHSVGITYYPSKYWALAVPSFVTVSVLLMMMLYLGLNFLVTPPPYSLNIIYDEYRPATFILSEGIRNQLTQSQIDVGINQINHLTFGGINH